MSLPAEVTKMGENPASRSNLSGLSAYPPASPTMCSPREGALLLTSRPTVGQDEDSGTRRDGCVGQERTCASGAQGHLAVLCNKEQGRKKVCNRSQTGQRSYLGRNDGELRGLVDGPSNDHTWRPGILSGHSVGLLRSIDTQGLHALPGNPSGQTDPLLDCFVSWDIDSPAVLYLSHRGSGHESKEPGSQSGPLHRRLVRCGASRSGGGTSQDTSHQADCMGIRRELEEEFAVSKPLIASPRSGGECREAEIRNTARQAEGHRQFRTCSGHQRDSTEEDNSKGNWQDPFGWKSPSYAQTVVLAADNRLVQHNGAKNHTLGPNKAGPVVAEAEHRIVFTPISPAAHADSSDRCVRIWLGSLPSIDPNSSQRSVVGNREWFGHPTTRDAGGHQRGRSTAPGWPSLLDNGQLVSHGLRGEAGRPKESADATPNLLPLSEDGNLPDRARQVDPIYDELRSRRLIAWETIRLSRDHKTMEQYDRAFRLWGEWMDRARLSPSPLALMAYMHSLRGTVHAKKALQWLSAIKLELRLRGQDRLYKDPRIGLYAEAVYREAPKSPRPQRDPVRIHHVQQLIPLLTLDKFIDLRDIVMILVGLCAFARAVELCSLLVKDLRRQDAGYVLRLRRVKTRQHTYANITLPDNPRMAAANPAPLIARYLRTLPIDAVFLFPALNGRPLTSQALSQVVRRRLHQAAIQGEFSSHSLRIGGAVLACEQGMTELEIRGLGGWKSNAIFQYVRDVRRTF